MNCAKFQSIGQLTLHEAFGTETHSEVFDTIESLMRIQKEGTRPEKLPKVSYDQVRFMIMLTEPFHWDRDSSK